MTAPGNDPSKHDPLLKNVRLRGDRHRHWLRESNPSMMRHLAQVGVLGWMIITPILIGIFLGRWLDRTFSSGLFCTGLFLMLGLALGCWSAWKWMNNS